MATYTVEQRPFPETDGFDPVTGAQWLPALWWCVCNDGELWDAPFESAEEAMEVKAMREERRHNAPPPWCNDEFDVGDAAWRAWEG